MKRILFVDDEPNILQGLKRMLRGMRGEWEMSFAESGPAALETMKEAPFDVVVSDMRMPGMDGAELLTETKHLYPNTVRFILSGHSENEAIHKAIGSTHQYLAKPCDPELLKSALQQACALQEHLTNDRIRGLVSQIQTLPSMPTLFQQVVSELQKPDGSLRKVGEIIECDVAMSAKILKLVNSAYFGTLQPMSNVGHAVVYLGLETINSLVLGISVFAQYEGKKILGFSIEALWRHCMRTAQFVKVVAEQEGLGKMPTEYAFMAGMLHDVGTLVLASAIPAEYRKVLDESKRGTRPIADVEHDVFGATHTEIGAYLMGLWGLPNPIVQAIAYHERPGEAGIAELGPLAVLHVANALERELDESAATAISSAVVDWEYLEKLGLEDRWPAWQQACEENAR